MTITIGTWCIPGILTIAMVCMILRPYKSSGDYDFGMVMRILWLIPIAIVWAVYFGIMLLLKK